MGLNAMSAIGSYVLAGASSTNKHEWNLGFNVKSFLAALAEILSVKEASSRKLYYVHYIDCEHNIVFSSIPSMAFILTIG